MLIHELNNNRFYEMKKILSFNEDFNTKRTR